jgi:hypothetical protein
VFQFREYPEDGPGALRVCFQEELADQIVFLGLVPFGLYALRTEPGTPLHMVVTWFRVNLGFWLCLVINLLEQLLQALGIMEV